MDGEKEGKPVSGPSSGSFWIGFYWIFIPFTIYPISEVKENSNFHPERFDNSAKCNR